MLARLLGFGRYKQGDNVYGKYERRNYIHKTYIRHVFNEYGYGNKRVYRNTAQQSYNVMFADFGFMKAAKHYCATCAERRKVK